MIKVNRTLKGITWNHLRGYGPLEASVEPYEDDQAIRTIWERRSLKDFGDVSIEVLAQQYDLIILDHPHVGTVAASNCIVPFDEILNVAILENLHRYSVGPSYGSYTYNNQQWALPIDAACQVVSYRQELLAEELLPSSWPEVFTLADNLKNQKKYIGIPLCATDCNASFLTLCAQNGNGPTEHAGFLAPIKTGYYALEMLRKLYQVCHPDSIFWNPITLYDYMSSEDVIPYCPLAFGYANYSRCDYAQRLLRFGAIPGNEGALLGGAGIALSRFCENKAAAAGYAVWLCEEAFQSTTYVHAGGQPAHQKAWLDSAVNKLTNDFFVDTLLTIENAYVRPRMLNWPDFQELLGEILHAYLLKGKNIAKTWDEITSCYNSLLKRRS